MTALVAARTGLLRREVLLEIRRLGLTALVTWILYSLLMAGSKGGCVDHAFEPASAVLVVGVETCETWLLRPSPVVGLAMAAVVLWSVGHIARGAHTDQQAALLLARASGWVVAIGIGSLLISQVWFRALPMPGAETVLFPFPFGAIESHWPGPSPAGSPVGPRE